jgi:hypothetical protein
MSWDALIAKPSNEVSGAPASGDSLLTIGSVRHVRSKIHESFPGITWNLNGMGFAQAQSLHLEFLLIGRRSDGSPFSAIAPEDQVESIGFAARGDGNPVEVVASFARTNGWSIADSQTGKWIDLNRVNDQSWREFVAYRDAVAAPSAIPAEPPSSRSLSVNLLISALVLIVLFFLLRRIKII